MTISQITDSTMPLSHKDASPGAGHPPGPDGLRQTAAFQPVLTIRARVDADDAARFTREALREIRSYINEEHLRVAGPPFSLARPLPDHRLDLEAGWPVRRAHGSGRIHSGALPVARVRISP